LIARDYQRHARALYRFNRIFELDLCTGCVA